MTQQIARLQQFHETKQRHQPSNGYKESFAGGGVNQNNAHETSILASLKDSIGGIGITFKDILEARTERMKKQQMHRDQFAPNSPMINRPQSPANNNNDNNPTNRYIYIYVCVCVYRALHI